MGNETCDALLENQPVTNAQIRRVNELVAECLFINRQAWIGYKSLTRYRGSRLNVRADAVHQIPNRLLGLILFTVANTHIGFPLRIRGLVTDISLLKHGDEKLGLSVCLFITHDIHTSLLFQEVLDFL